MERRQHDRLWRPGRRESDRRIHASETRRVLLLGPDEDWRLLTAHEFKEAGYTVYAAVDLLQAVALTTRLLPDVVVVQLATPRIFSILARLSEGPSTNDIPIVVLTSSLQSTEAHLVREAGGVALLAHATEVDALIGEVDTLIAVEARAQRALKRRLLDIRELARLFAPGDEGRDRLRQLINHLASAHVGGRCAGALHRRERRHHAADGLFPPAAADHLGPPGRFRGRPYTCGTLARVSGASAVCRDDYDYQWRRRGRDGPRGRGGGGHAGRSCGRTCRRMTFAQHSF